jgi:MFS family permease
VDNRRRLFVASCAALVANAMAFALRIDIMGDLETVFGLSKMEVGEAVAWGAIGGVLVQFVGGALLDFVGISNMLWLAVASHLAGLSLFIFAQDFWTLAAGGLFLAIAGNLIEASINPLAASMYPQKKTHVLNVLHAWWPGGIIIGGLLAYGLTKVFASYEILGGLANSYDWQIKIALAYAPVALYAALIFGQKFPKTERVNAGVSAGTMFREGLRPMFLLLVFAMLLTASVELGPNNWVGVFINDIVGIRGVLMLVYTSGLMFVLRHFAGPLAKRISSMGILIASSVLSGLGLLWLSYATDGTTVFLAATVFGVGVTYFWPTMLGVTAERFPKGGAFLLGILGAAAGLFLSYVTTPGMGWLHDHYTLGNLPSAVAKEVVVGGRVDQERVDALPDVEKATVKDARRVAASTTFRYVAGMAAILIVVFGGIILRDRATAGRRTAAPPGALGGGGSGGGG